MEETQARMWSGLVALPLLLLYTLPPATQAESVGEKILRKIGRPALLYTGLAQAAPLDSSITSQIAGSSH